MWGHCLVGLPSVETASEDGLPTAQPWVGPEAPPRLHVLPSITHVWSSGCWRDYGAWGLEQKYSVARLGGRPWPPGLLPSCHQSFCAWQPLPGQGPSRSADMLFLGGRGSCLPHRDAQACPRRVWAQTHEVVSPLSQPAPQLHWPTAVVRFSPAGGQGRMLFPAFILQRPSCQC